MFVNGSFTYESTGGGAMKLRDMMNPEGVVVKTTTGYAYRYFMRDYLNSVRHVSGIEQLTDYDPLGQILVYRNQNLKDNTYLYESKELYTDFSSAYMGVYDFGARFYNPLYGRWFAPDPAKQDINPYIYCGNNPVMLVDPDGNDYYQSATGAIVWRNRSRQTITINKEIFTNIGKSYSVPLIDNTYANYYQNVFVSVSEKPENVEKTILESQKIKGFMLSKDSPLTLESQVGLMQSSIYQGQNDFIRGAADFTGEVLQDVGTLTTVAGYVVSATGIGLGAGLAISELGNGISKMGLGITTLTNLSDGNYEKAVVNVGTYFLGEGVDKLAKYGSMGVEAIHGGVNLIFTPLQIMVGNIKYRNKKDE